MIDEEMTYSYRVCVVRGGERACATDSRVPSLRGRPSYPSSEHNCPNKSKNVI
jgi:hypothetical protein